VLHQLPTSINPHDPQFFLIILFPDLKEDDNNMTKPGPKPLILAEKHWRVLFVSSKSADGDKSLVIFSPFPLTEPLAFFSAYKLLTATESHLELISFALTVKLFALPPLSY